jgi:hypothetical protein
MVFNLGDRVKDTVTGIEGILWAKTQWMTGCDHYGIKREGTDKDGKAYDLVWVDEPLVVAATKKTKRFELPKTVSRRPGGPALHRMPSQDRR